MPRKTPHFAPIVYFRQYSSNKWDWIIVYPNHSKDESGSFFPTKQEALDNFSYYHPEFIVKWV